ncbi:hypothetical protein GY45DRAFT_243502 [Cubamyces sp. BRFM 1775]|nr:hypothetical protein GY45DRAFT_243502 [Cubamyces sp. BRFM 1775]
MRIQDRYRDSGTAALAFKGLCLGWSRRAWRRAGIGCRLFESSAPAPASPWTRVPGAAQHWLGVDENPHNRYGQKPHPCVLLNFTASLWAHGGTHESKFEPTAKGSLPRQGGPVYSSCGNRPFIRRILTQKLARTEGDECQRSSTYHRLLRVFLSFRSTSWGAPRTCRPLRTMRRAYVLATAWKFRRSTVGQVRQCGMVAGDCEILAQGDVSRSVHPQTLRYMSSDPMARSPQLIDGTARHAACAHLNKPRSYWARTASRSRSRPALFTFVGVARSSWPVTTPNTFLHLVIPAQL